MIVSATALRERLAEYLDRVGNDREVLHVTRQGARSVVILDEDEYESILETLHLLRPANAKELLASIADFEAGRNLVEFDTTEARNETITAIVEKQKSKLP